MRRFFLVVVIGITFTAAARTTTSPTRNFRLVQPWSKLKSLSETQRRQIYNIHQRALEEIKKVKQHENSEIVALLSDQQKIELAEVDEEKTVSQKLRAAANRDATTAPSTAPAQ